VTHNGGEMAKRLLLMASLALAGCCVLAQTSAAKGAGMTAAPGGVTVTGSPYRYVAISPGFPGKVTVVGRIDRDGGKVGRWWHLPGSWFVPAVAYDGSGGGLSADGRTLVLQRFTQTYPPRTTRLALLDTGPVRRNPAQRRQPGPFRFLSLRGHFAIDAISPDGTFAYLKHYDLPVGSGPNYITDYEVRVLDLSSGRLLPQPIVDPEEPDEQMGLPITRATSPDGRWAYTLYDGVRHQPLLHALDTVAGRAVVADLPQLQGRRSLFLLDLVVEPRSGDLTILARSPKAWVKTTTPLLAVEASTLEVSPVATPGVEASARGRNAGPSWPLIGLSVGAVVLTAIVLGMFGNRGARGRDSKRRQAGTRGGGAFRRP